MPVIRGQSGLRGVEAVIDKDLTAALLAQALGAERLVLATDVSFVETGWGTNAASPIVSATPSDLRAMQFAAGSMAPKIEAACRFVEHTGCSAACGARSGDSRNGGDADRYFSRMCDCVVKRSRLHRIADDTCDFTQ